MIGRTISHYRITEKLGEGGMGVVYQAEDTKLKRTVGVKFLPHELTRDPDAKDRFVHEAQAAAALNHAHICTVYEIDEHDGQSFIAMEFIEGESLKDRIQRGPLPIDDLLSLTIQIGEGLHKAHEKGIVHRDIKPENIMVTADGEAKILDFGLAKLRGQTRLTRGDTTLGTASYMSPEQASGKEVDRRTDIWSLGVVLYEMVTGQRPFKGEYEPAVVYAILHDEPEPLTSRRSNVPMELERIVGKALTKEASGRYPHVEDMLVDLRALRTAAKTGGISHPQEAAAKKERNRLALVVGAFGILAVVVIGLAIVPRLFKSGTQLREPLGPGRQKMLVVLPFENLGSPEDEYFANGITDAINARLSRVSGLGVISRQSAMQYKKTTKTVRQIGSELGVDYILEGTVQRERPGDPSSRVRVIPQLIGVANDTNVWAETYDENMAEVFRVQSDIAERVAAQLDVALLEPERRAIEKKPTDNLAAYDDYLRGKSIYGRVDLPSAELCVQLFQKAVSADPRFAEAWAGLAMAYLSLYWFFDRPDALSLETEAAERAKELAPDLPETHLALGSVAYAHREFEKALMHFEMAQKLQPSGDAAQIVGYTLRRLGRWQEALRCFEDARRLTPLDYSIYVDGLGTTRMYLRRFDEAERDFDQTISLAPQIEWGYVGKANVLLARDANIDAAKQVMSDMSTSGHVSLAEVAVRQVTGVIIDWTLMRTLPQTYTEVFDAFESGPIEQFRRIQPAAIATTHLVRAVVYEAKDDRRSAGARYDSARVCYERIIRSNPQSAYICFYHAALGLSYAGLGRRADAIREGKEAVRLMPISQDALVGTDLVWLLAEIYAMSGEYELAVSQLETALSVPSYISSGFLRVDPIWDPLRSHPRFQRLVEGK